MCPPQSGHMQSLHSEAKRLLVAETHSQCTDHRNTHPHWGWQHHNLAKLLFSWTRKFVHWKQNTFCGIYFICSCKRNFWLFSVCSVQKLLVAAFRVPVLATFNGQKTKVPVPYEGIFSKSLLVQVGSGFVPNVAVDNQDQKKYPRTTREESAWRCHKASQTNLKDLATKARWKLRCCRARVEKHPWGDKWRVKWMGKLQVKRGTTFVGV